jgi:hypothetical protein
MPKTRTCKAGQQTNGRQGPDDLGPSHYARRVGAIDVLVVSDGVLTALPGATLAVNVDPAVGIALDLLRSEREPRRAAGDHHARAAVALAKDWWRRRESNPLVWGGERRWRAR